MNILVFEGAEFKTGYFRLTEYISKTEGRGRIHTHIPSNSC